MKRAKQFIVNTAVMTLTSLILQSIGMVFNVYISNRIGAQGVGLFTVIMSVNSLMVTFSTGGVYISTVRLVSRARGIGSEREIACAVRKCTVYAVVCGLATCMAGLMSADYMGNNFLGDERSVRCIKILAVIQPINSLSCVIGGYFGAEKKVIKSAAVQITDEVLTVAAVCYGLTIFSDGGVEYACIAIIGGNCVAHVISTLGSLVIFAYDIKRHSEKGGSVSTSLTKQMLDIALPVAVTSYAKSGLSTVKNLLIPYCLRLGGNSSQIALEQYGMLQGMAFPVIMFPQIVIAAMAGLMVPEITKSKVRRNYNNVKYIISRAFHAVSIYAVGISGILLGFAHEIGGIIYSNETVSEYIMLLTPLVPLLYIDAVVDASLSGLDEQVNAMKISIADSVISIVLVGLLLPVYGIKGYVVTMYVCKSFNCCLSIVRLVKSSGLKINFYKWVLSPIISCLCSVTSVILLSNILEISCGVKETALKIITAIYLYVFFLRVTGCTDSVDMHWIKSVLCSKI